MLAAQTLQAEASGSLLAKSAEMDLLLRLAGTSQISRALREKGSSAGRPFLLVVAGRTKPAEIGAVSCKELPRRELSKNELRRVEKAALLSVKG
jgi:tRNA threonylcarbamoyladenosine modification (KEOPS) complex Cgi121 subunit